MNNTKRLLAIVVCVMMILPCLPLGISAAYENTHVNTGNQIEDLIAVATSQIGYTEGNSTSQMGGTSGGSGNYTKYGKWYGINPGAWCAMFVSWCANQAGIPKTTITSHASCDIGMQWFQKNGYWQWSPACGGTYQPKRGDIIYFRTNTNQVADSTHVGIVYNSDASKVYTIEGNASNKCQKKSYALSSAYIIGYGTPPYTGTESTVTKELGTYIVTAANLNMRSEPSSSGTIVKVLKSGDAIVVTQISGKWAYTNFGGVSGWCSMNYLLAQNDIKYAVSNDGIDFIKSLEGFSQYAYWDYEQWTIGYGTACGENEYPNGITEAEADALLRSAVLKYELYVNSFVSSNNVELNQNQYDALVSFTYNLGNVWTGDFTLKTYLLNGINNYTDDQIKAAFGEHVTAGGEVLAGLVSRRNLEAELFLSGDNSQTSISEVYETTASWLAMRDGPGTSYESLTSLPRGTRVTITQISGTWGYTSYDGYNGWISMNYCQKVVSKNYTMTFDPNGGEMVGATTYGINKGESYAEVMSEIPLATKAGYTLNGWYCEKYGYTLSLADVYSVDEDVTFVAVWQASACTVSFDANGGEGAPAAIATTVGETVSVSAAAPTRAGYVFLGWAESATADAATVKAGASYTVNGDVTLYAVWQDQAGHVHSYVLTSSDSHCTEGGVATYTCSCGDSYTEALAADGHDFGEWGTTIQPTTEFVGRKQRSCECGAVEVDILPKLSSVNSGTAGEKASTINPQLDGETSRTVKTLYPGVTSTNITTSSSSKYELENINIVEFDLKQTDLYIDVTNERDYANQSKTTLNTVKDFNANNGEGKTAIAAINGDLWMMSSAHSRVEGKGTSYGGYSDAVVTKALTLPRGFNVYDGEIVCSAYMQQETPYEGEFWSFGVTKDNVPMIGCPELIISVTNNATGTTVNPHGLNRLPANNALVVYSDKGCLNNYALADAYEVVIDCDYDYTVKSGASITGKVTGIYSSATTANPEMKENRIILTARGTALSMLTSFAVGNSVTLNFAVNEKYNRNSEGWQNVENAVGGHMPFVVDGVKQETGSTNNYPTTIVGIKHDGSLCFVVNDGRQSSFSTGFDFDMYWNLADDLDLNTAFILDGGGSANLVELDGSEYAVVNQPSDGSARSVVNSVILSAGPEREPQGHFEVEIPSPDIDLTNLYFAGSDAFNLIGNQAEMRMNKTANGAQLVTWDILNGPSVSISYGLPNTSSKNPNSFLADKTYPSVNASSYPYVVLDFAVTSASSSVVQYQSFYATSGSTYVINSNNFIGFNNALNNAGFGKYILNPGANSYYKNQLNTFRYGFLFPANGVTTVTGDYVTLRSVRLAKTAAEANAMTTGQPSVLTVNFNANGGELDTTQKTVIQGQKMGSFPTPTREGYVFDGWYTSANGGAKVTSSTNAAATTLYAHWTEETTEDPGIAAPDLDYEGELSKVVSYKTTASWLTMRDTASSDGAAVTSLPKDTVVTTSDLNGKWGKVSYDGNTGWISLNYGEPTCGQTIWTLGFDAGEGTLVGTELYGINTGDYYAEAITANPSAVREGYDFCGWYNEKYDITLNNPIDPSLRFELTEDLVFTAIWEEAAEHSHSYTSQVTKEASCSAEGVRTFTCTCGDSYTVAIAKLDHVYSNYASNNDATCGTDGTLSAECDYGCGSVDTMLDEDSATGNHTWGVWETVTEPTYTAAGLKTRLCIVCYATEAQEIPKLEYVETTEPTVLGVMNYTVVLGNINDIKEIRYAIGHYTKGQEVREAEKNQTLSASLVAKYTVDGIMTYEVPWVGEYTFWVRLNDGTSYFVYADVTEIDPYVVSDGLRLTVKDFGENYKDLWIAEGTWGSYAEIKNYVAAGAKYQAAAAKLSNYFADHDFTYTCANPGDYTVLIRYNDGTQDVIHTTLTVDVPTFEVNGLQVTVGNIPGVKIIRTAYGEYDSVAAIKGASGVRNFNNKTAIKDAESYKIQYRENGVVTIIVEYATGYKHVEHINIQQKVPTFDQKGNSITVGDLDGLVMVRYAPGTYKTSNGVKNAEGSRYIKPDAIVDGRIVFDILSAGKWTVCVQYDDESYNFYHITVAESDIPAAPCSHKWSEWKVTVAATYDKEGTEERSCTLCGEKETRTVSKLVCTHSWGGWTVTTPATETKEGVETRTCTLCGTTETRAIPKLEPAVVTPTATNVRVSNAFSDNMILQRDEALSVWGFADANSGNVVVTLGGKTATAKVDAQGNWKATFKETFSYTTEGQPLTVQGAGFTKTFNDVLIGDVYYIIGQSNVFYSMGELILDLRLLGKESELVVDYDDRRDIRFFRMSNMDYVGLTGDYAQGTTLEFTDVINGETWKKPTDIAMQIIQYANFTPTSYSYNRDAISMEVFSAIGYMFAYNLSTKTDVPCGVIEIDASGHSLISFAPNELADKWGHDELGADGRYYYKLNEAIYNTNLRSRYVYNQQINPLKNFSCAGIIWYQGESDMSNTREMFGSDYDNHFAKQFTELMTYYRQNFGNDDFDVYMFEFPACYYNNGNNAYMDFGAVRAELGTIPQLLSDCHIVSSSDLFWDAGWWNNIHPPIKHLNAYRLTDIVMADKHGVGNIEDVSGPVLKDVEYNGTSATLTFNNVGAGLKTADGTGNLIGIEVFVQLNGEYVWAPINGTFISGKDTVTFDVGTEILAVRYGRGIESTHPYGRNLCNDYGMPAVAFVDYK